MLEVLKIVHFLSFSVAIGAGVSNLLLAARMRSFPVEAMPQLGGYRLQLGKLSSVGLLLLWITGIGLISVTQGAAIFTNAVFLWKLGAVLVLTAFSLAANVTVAQARSEGAPPDAQRMKRLGQGALTMAILSVVLAVFAFS